MPQHSDALNRRWAKPPEILAVEDATDEAWVDNGRTYAGVNVTVSRDDAERIRLGRMCIQCFEPQETPFPKNCSLCRFAMGEMQMRVYERYWEGEKRIGSSVDLNDELDRLDDEFAHDQWKARGGVSVGLGAAWGRRSKSGLVLPPGSDN